MCVPSLLEKTFEYVSSVLSDEPSSHEIYHIKRVEALCVEICNMERVSGRKDIDPEILRLAALLHDVGVVKEHREGGDHSIYGAQMATDFLLSQGLEADRVEKIASCIRSHRFSSGIKAICIEG